MEFLNNIWISISTPNEVLTNIIVSLSSFIENFLIMILFINILEISANKKQKLIYVLMMSFISICSIYLLSSPFNILFNYLAMIVLSHIIFNNSILKSSACIIITGIIFNIIGAFLLNPYLTILNISTNELTSIPIYRFLYIFLMYFVVFAIYLVIKYRNLKIKFIEMVDKHTKYVIITNMILGIITIIIQSIILFYYVDTLPNIITFLNFICFLSYFILSIYSLTRAFKLISTTQKLQSAEEYNNTLHILHDSVRGFKHDFDNIVTTIGGFIRTNDMKGLEDYYVQLEDDCQRVNNLYILNPKIINNDGIYNLLTKKYHEANSKDIKVNITFLLDLSTLKMKIYEFARILGILLDNAIEASSECEEKVINLTFRDDSRNHRQLIIIENTYTNKSVDIDKIFQKGFSEKDSHTGLGLWEVRKIIKKNKNINLHTSKNNEFFIQQLELYY